MLCRYHAGPKLTLLSSYLKKLVRTKALILIFKPEAERNGDGGLKAIPPISLPPTLPKNDSKFFTSKSGYGPLG